MSSNRSQTTLTGPIVPISEPDRDQTTSPIDNYTQMYPIGVIPESWKDGRQVFLEDRSKMGEPLKFAGRYSQEHGLWYDTVAHRFQQPTHYLDY